MSETQSDTFQIAPAFAVPMVFARMADCEQMNRELAEVFHATAAEGDRYRNPDPFVARNEALFESNFSLFEWPQPCIQKLRQFCLSNLYRTIGELNGYDTETLRRLHMAVESWFHITARGGFFGAHNHPLHSWSGVYCVRHDGDDPDSSSGKLTFLHPNSAASMYIDKSISDMRRPYSLGQNQLRLEAGQLVLFPSWLLHEVLPYEGETERITVAFNVRFKMEGVERTHEARK